MSTSSGNSRRSLAGLVGFLRRVLGGARQPDPAPLQPVGLPDNLNEPVRIVTNRVLLVIYDPVMDPVSGETLTRKMQWQRPDDLVAGFTQEILEASSGVARYEIVERVALNEFPAKTDGFRYGPTSYMNVLRGGQPYKPEGVDYLAILTGLNVLPRVVKREFDEVWIFSFPHAGFYESTMGGAGAFWCNAPPLSGTGGCSRKFVVMGFSVERGIGEMLEAFGHRAESVLTKVFEKTSGEANLYSRFSRYDKRAPGKAEVGTIHFAPNSEREYDWKNARKVMSNCYDWLNFPKFQNDVREVNLKDWGGGDIQAHHKWWLAHLPKVAGRTNGVANNWWQYVMDPGLVNL
ncbi:MAG: hypothetical protein JXB85_02025 [Anaerolineales bacterium]|nr:hypothetical protein [Anaerolineales bacterium]